MNEINLIYNEFKDLFNREKCPELFRAIDKVSSSSSNSHFPHALGNFAILYTPATYRPEFMLLGNNPSWFVDVAVNRPLSAEDKEKAQQIVLDMEKGVPSINSYLEHNHRFAKRIRTIFKNLDLSDILPDVVGMNWFWVQTGSNPYELKKVHLCDLRSEQKKTEQLNYLINYCRRKTGEIINHIAPKNLFVLGADAQLEVNRMDINRRHIKIIHAINPGRSSDLEHQIRKIFI